MGNGVETTDNKQAATDLLNRDHKKVLKLLRRYSRGMLGAYFVPPMFFGIPEVIKPEQYDEKANTGDFEEIQFVSGLLHFWSFFFVNCTKVSCHFYLH